MKKILVSLVFPLCAGSKVEVYSLPLSFLMSAQIIYIPKFPVVLELKTEFLDTPYGSYEAIKEIIALDANIDCVIWVKKL